MTKISIVYSTFTNHDDASKAAHVVLGENLATCVNILPNHTAIYKWNGVLNQEIEVIAIFKTLPSLLEQLKNKLHAIHPYEVPCIISWDASALEDYAETFKA